MKLNIIIPCFNEEGNVSLMHDKIKETLSDIKYELIYVNDGSKDNTEKKLNDNSNVLFIFILYII